MIASAASIRLFMLLALGCSWWCGDVQPLAGLAGVARWQHGRWGGRHSSERRSAARLASRSPDLRRLARLVAWLSDGKTVVAGLVGRLPRGGD